MSLNVDQGRYDLLSKDQATRYASWAVYWLSDVLWMELITGREFSPAWANDVAVKALESRGWIDGWSITADSITALIRFILMDDDES